ncbi:MAG: carbohydrate ABC transporter permease [Clostridiales bacterium]|nr:carbohydrate ABC transporter permease [Clostridiales bacterium]
MRIKRSRSDYFIDGLILLVMLMVLVITLYPFLNSLAISLNDSKDSVKGGITIWPRVFTWNNYVLIFNNERIPRAYLISIARTVIGTILGLLFTGSLAFGLAHTNLVGRKIYTIICLIPMYFGGGIIPTFLLIKSMGLLNNFWVYIIPGVVGLWNMILMRTYFQTIPDGLEESAVIDGASYLRIFFQIIIPISAPIIATIALYIGVAQWNSWFDAAMYITKDSLKPMQTILMNVISEARYAEQLAQSGITDVGNMLKGQNTNVRSITMATMVVTVLPILMIYPFLQRYFIKGIMVGSLKG